MANETILNMFSKMKTVINNIGDNIPKYTIGSIIDNKYQVIDKLSGVSGEADLYKVADCNKPSNSSNPSSPSQRFSKGTSSIFS